MWDKDFYFILLLFPKHYGIFNLAGILRALLVTSVCVTWLICIYLYFDNEIKQYIKLYGCINIDLYIWYP